MQVTISLDRIEICEKPPKKSHIFAEISNRIAKNAVSITLEELLDYTVNKKYSWAPVVFFYGKRITENFKSQQLFALDFDETLSWEEVRKRAEYYNLPIAFAYETFSSVNENRFRVAFCFNESVDNKRIANAIQLALMAIFPEADPQCKDVARYFLGGKKIMYLNTDDSKTIDFYTLINSMTIFLKRRDEGNYQRNLRNYAENIGLKRKNGVIQFVLPATNDEGIEKYIKNSEEMGEIPIIFNIENAPIPSNFCIVYLTDEVKVTKKNGDIVYVDKNMKIGRRKPELVLNGFDEVKNRCRLFKEFYEGSRWLFHGELFGLATNIVKIKGGKKEFKNILNGSQNDKWDSYVEKNFESQVDYIFDEDYYAQHCSGYCPYKNECNHAETILATVKTKRNTIHVLNQEESYFGLQEIENDLSQIVHKMINYPGNHINLGVSQTGSGKSKTYKDLIKEADINKAAKRYLIAAPTNDLKQEIFNDLKAMGVNVIATPSFKELSGIPKYVQDYVEKLYAIGADKQVSNYIRFLANQKEYDYEVLKDYQNSQDRIQNFEGHIVTTHARLLTYPPEFLKKYEVIIDEDILKSLLQIQCVDMEDLETIKEIALNFGPVIGRIYEVESIKESKTEFYRFNPVSEELIEQLYKEILESNCYINSNVIGFLKSEYCYINHESSEVHFIVPRSLCKSVKYIVLSATANKDIYELIFGSKRVRYYECKQARYAGSLKQYYSKSFSRCYIEKHKDIYQRIKKYVGRYLPTITFMKYKYLLDRKEMPHFGKAEGFNGYKGQDIAVVGTPHNCEFVYKLVAFSLNQPIDDILQYQEVEYGNYKFWFIVERHFAIGSNSKLKWHQNG